MKFGLLWYHSMGSDQIRALKQNRGDSEAVVVFSTEAVIFTDAFSNGCGYSCELGRTGGHWDSAEAQSNKTVLQLKIETRLISI